MPIAMLLQQFHLQTAVFILFIYEHGAVNCLSSEFRVSPRHKRPNPTLHLIIAEVSQSSTVITKKLINKVMAHSNLSLLH